MSGTMDPMATEVDQQALAGNSRNGTRTVLKTGRMPSVVMDLSNEEGWSCGHDDVVRDRV